MAHDHSHDHNHSMPRDAGKAFLWGVFLNAGFVVAEAIVGFSTHSLSLLSDAGHNLADVGSLGLSMLAFRMMKVSASKQYTFGYRKSTVLAALINAIILLISLGAIVYEAVQRFFERQPLPGLSIAAMAVAGIFVNGFSAWLFNKDKKNDINVRGAYLHLLADAAISAGVAVTGVIIYYTSWYRLDAAVSIGIAIAIFISTWKLLKESIRLSLDGVPDGIDLALVKEAAMKIDGVIDFRHIHVWAISSTENALTGHLVVSDPASPYEVQKIKDRLKHDLSHQNITHITLETETPATKSKEENCDI